MKDKQDKLWTKDFSLHCLSYLLMSIAFYFLLPTLPIYVVNILHEDTSKVGYIIGFYALSALLVRPFAGYAMDVYGRRNIYRWAMVFYILLMAAYNLAGTFFLLIIVRLLHGVTWGIITTGGSTITADLVPISKRGQGIGIFGLSVTLSMALGPIIGLMIMGDDSFSRLFYASAFMGLLALLIVQKVNIPHFTHEKTKIRWNTIFEKKVLPIAFVMLIAAVPFAGIMSFITLYSDEIGIANGGSFFLAYALGVSVFRPFAGAIMDRKGPVLLMFGSFVATIGGLLLLSYSQTLWHFLLAAFITGLGNGVLMPTIQTMIINMVVPRRRGVANSTFFSAIDLGIGVGSVILGYLADYTSIAFMYRVCALMLVIPMVYFFSFVVKHYYITVSQIKSAE